MTDTPTLIARLRRDHWIQRDTSGAIVTAFIERDCAEAADALEALACDNASLVETARKNNDTIEHLLAERDALQVELDNVRKLGNLSNALWVDNAAVDDPKGRLDEMVEEQEALLAERDRLREALEPFADIGDVYDSRYGPDAEIGVRLYSLRRARAALSGEGGEK